MYGILVMCIKPGYPFTSKLIFEKAKIYLKRINYFIGYCLWFICIIYKETFCA